MTDGHTIVSFYIRALIDLGALGGKAIWDRTKKEAIPTFVPAQGMR